MCVTQYFCRYTRLGTGRGPPGRRCRAQPLTTLLWEPVRGRHLVSGAMPHFNAFVSGRPFLADVCIIEHSQGHAGHSYFFLLVALCNPFAGFAGNPGILTHLEEVNPEAVMLPRPHRPILLTPVVPCTDGLCVCASPAFLFWPLGPPSPEDCLPGPLCSSFLFSSLHLMCSGDSYNADFIIN